MVQYNIHGRIVMVSQMKQKSDLPEGILNDIDTLEFFGFKGYKAKVKDKVNIYISPAKGAEPTLVNQTNFNLFLKKSINTAISKRAKCKQVWLTPRQAIFILLNEAVIPSKQTFERTFCFPNIDFGNHTAHLVIASTTKEILYKG